DRGPVVRPAQGFDDAKTIDLAGQQRSRIITSYWPVAARKRPPRPLSAWSTVWPSSASPLRTNCATLSLSSTSKTFIAARQSLELRGAVASADASAPFFKGKS